MPGSNCCCTWYSITAFTLITPTSTAVVRLTITKGLIDIFTSSKQASSVDKSGNLVPTKAKARAKAKAKAKAEAKSKAEANLNVNDMMPVRILPSAYLILTLVIDCRDFFSLGKMLTINSGKSESVSYVPEVYANRKHKLLKKSEIAEPYAQ